MPVGINFSKAKAERMLKALQTGEPIRPSGSGWTVDDMLALAGACYFGAMSHGPVRLDERDRSKLPLEHREARDERFMDDLAAAVRFYADLTMKVKDGEYDAVCTPEARAIVSTTADGVSFTPIDGFKPI